MTKFPTLDSPGLIDGDDDSLASQKSDAVTPGKNAGGWGWYVLAGVIAGGGVMLVRGVVQRRHKARRATFNRFSRCEQRYWQWQWTCPGICGRGSGGTRHGDNDLPTDPVKANAVKPGGLKPEAAVTQNGSNGSSNGSTHRRGARRKKIFDYHRFYTDTVMKLSSSGYTAEVPPRNGHTNGHSDGHSSAPAIEAQPASYGAMNQAIVQSHLDLIANQKVPH